MRLYAGNTPIKFGSIIYFKGVKYKVIKVESAANGTSIVFKMKAVG